MLDIFLGYCRNAYKSVTSWCKKINTFAFLQHLDGVSSWDLRCWLSGFKLAAALKLKNYWMLPIGFRLHWKWKELIDTCNISTTNSILLYSYHTHTYIHIYIYVYIHISSYIIIYIYYRYRTAKPQKISGTHTHTMITPSHKTWFFWHLAYFELTHMQLHTAHGFCLHMLTAYSQSQSMSKNLNKSNALECCHTLAAGQKFGIVWNCCPIKYSIRMSWWAKAKMEVNHANMEKHCSLLAWSVDPACLWRSGRSKGNRSALDQLGA